VPDFMAVIAVAFFIRMVSLISACKGDKNKKTREYFMIFIIYPLLDL
jgi:hypothetical protein